MLRLDPAGTLSRLDLAPPASGFLQWQILDFALDRDAGVYLLEQVTTHDGGATTLRKIGADGVEAWRRSERSWRVDPDPEVPAWSFTSLLTGGSGVYLSAAQERGLIARIDPASGRLTRYADLAPWTGDALVGPDERVHYVRFVPERNARAWVRLDPETGRETETLCSPAAFDLLALPIGVDAQGRTYGVHGWTVGCIGPQGALLWRESLDGSSAEVQNAVGETGISAWSRRPPGGWIATARSISRPSGPPVSTSSLWSMVTYDRPLTDEPEPRPRGSFSRPDRDPDAQLRTDVRAPGGPRKSGPAAAPGLRRPDRTPTPGSARMSGLQEAVGNQACCGFWAPACCRPSPT